MQSRTMSTKSQQTIKRLGLLFVVVIPLILVIFMYVQSYTRSQRVSFDTSSSDPMYVNEFIAIDELKGLSLDVEWDVLQLPTSNEQGELTGGYYRFKIRYNPDENTSISSVSVTPVLQTDWADLSVVGETINLTTAYTDMLIEFNHTLPISPLFFVKVTDPNLYLKLTYLHVIAGLQTQKTIYIKYPLHNLYPNHA